MWNHSGGKGGGAAKQRVILGSFCWVPVSLRDGGHPVDKKGIWTTLYLEVESVVPQASEAIQEMGRRQCSRVRPSTNPATALPRRATRGGPGPARGRDASQGSAGRRRRRRTSMGRFRRRKPAVAWLPHVQHNAQAPQVGWWISSFTVAAAQNTIGTSIFTMLPDYPPKQSARPAIYHRSPTSKEVPTGSAESSENSSSDSTKRSLRRPTRGRKMP